jgi:hypothetical protein
LLLWWGAIIFACHALILIAWQAGLPPEVRWVASTLQFVLLAWGFFRRQSGRILPANRSERQLWTIWIGYLLAFGAIATIDMQLAARDAAGVAREGNGHAGPWTVYPYSTLLSGFAFFVMGSTYWGGCYLIGAGFLLAAALMPGKMEISPLVFALLWGSALSLLGWRLRRLGRAESPAHAGPGPADAATAPVPPSAGPSS